MTELTQLTASGPSAAFFDLDRTLISGSSVAVFGVAAYRAGLISTAETARDAFAALRFRLSGASDARSEEVRDRVLGAVRHINHEDLVALNAQIVPRLIAKVRPESQRLLDLHRHAGRATYIVSASLIELVDPLAKALGMTAGIGTRSEVIDGRYTGQLDGPFCYGEGKVQAIAEIARWERFDLAQCWAYSDSASDLPMLRAVGHPVAVNPDSRLAREARSNGWPIVIFSQRTKAVVRRTTRAMATVGVAAGSFAAGARFARSRA